ncbi:MAG: hypothetical protein K2J67_12010, partial [Lachnospiraceae bacterium]|nr:hypothetical protein [Lachnospiraceae bacterium]
SSMSASGAGLFFSLSDSEVVSGAWVLFSLSDWEAASGAWVLLVNDSVVLSGVWVLLNDSVVTLGVWVFALPRISELTPDACVFWPRSVLSAGTVCACRERGLPVMLSKREKIKTGTVFLCIWILDSKGKNDFIEIPSCIRKLLS